jgi:hypothetical protein
MVLTRTKYKIISILPFSLPHQKCSKSSKQSFFAFATTGVHSPEKVDLHNKMSKMISHLIMFSRWKD